MIWANVTKFGQNFIAPQNFWAGTAMTVYNSKTGKIVSKELNVS